MEPATSSTMDFAAETEKSLTKLRCNLFELAKVRAAIAEHHCLPAQLTQYRIPKGPAFMELDKTSKLVSAVALLGAVRPGWEHVTAVALELSTESPTLSNNIKFRIAQNVSQISPADLTSLQELMDIVVQYTNGEDGDRWCSLHSRSDRKAADEILQKFVIKILVSAIAVHCRDKIVTMVIRRRRQFQICWNQILSESNPGELDHVRGAMEDLVASLMSFGSQNVGEDCKRCIIAAALANLEDAETQIDALWQRVRTRSSATSNTTPEDLKEPENSCSTEDITEVVGNDNGGQPASCLVNRLIKKLSRYYHCAISLTRGALLLRRKLKGQKITVEVLPVPGADGSAPVEAQSLKKSELFSTFKASYLKRGLLHDKCFQHHSESFTKPKNVPIYVHAELKIAIYYCTHPLLIPSGSIIGVSKYCCTLCDKFLKSFQKPLGSVPAVETTSFYIKGCHGKVYSNWLLPIPRIHDTSLVQQEFDDFISHLYAAAKETFAAMQADTNNLLDEYCQFRGHHSDSSGASEELGESCPRAMLREEMDSLQRASGEEMGGKTYGRGQGSITLVA